MSKWDDHSEEDYFRREKTKKGKKPKKSSNKRLNIKISPKKWDELQSSDEYFAARVVEVHKRYAFVSPEPELLEIINKDVWLATVPKKFLQSERKDRNLISVGDRALCKVNREEESVSQELPQCSIEHIRERENRISRLDPMTQERRHILACNIDQLVVVASFYDPKVKWGLIDRYLVLAESEGIEAAIILNKRDLFEATDKESFREDANARIENYRKMGYTVILLQANFSQESREFEREVEQLGPVFDEKVSLLSGHSGVGKSSLSNMLSPDIVQDVETESIFYKGRHTTTYASMIKLGIGGYIIDTPGIRSFAIEEQSAFDLSWCFRDLRPFLNQCQFRECRHVDEPNCAVRDAVKDGGIKRWRYESYVGILSGATGREGRITEIDI